MIVVLSPVVLLCDETTAVGVAKIIRIRCCTVLARVPFQRLTLVALALK